MIAMGELYLKKRIGVKEGVVGRNIAVLGQQIHAFDLFCRPSIDSNILR
jgi:hypothetical protein